MSTATARSSSSSSAGFLSRILMVDAATCLLMGLLLVFAAQPLGALLALPSNLLFYAGLLLFPCAALMVFAGRKTSPNSILVWLVILGNVAWVAASILVITAWFSPSSLGLAFVLAQAAAVSILALVEYRGLKNS